MPPRWLRPVLAIFALAAAVATGVAAARGAHIAWVVGGALVMSMTGSAAVLGQLAVIVPRGELAVLIGGRHRGADRRWRGWRIVLSGTRTLRLPGEEVVRVAVPADRLGDVAAAIDAALWRAGTRGDNAQVVQQASETA